MDALCILPANFILEYLFVDFISVKSICQAVMLKGIFAAGDVRAGSTKQLVSAAGEGAAAALAIREHLRGHDAHTMENALVEATAKGK